MILGEDEDDLAAYMQRERPLPPRPTKHLPGSGGKIRMMAWRYENRYQLFHPDDAKGPPELPEEDTPDLSNRVREPRRARSLASVGLR